VFDITMKHSKWLAKLGAIGYDSLILINSLVNYFSMKMGKGKVSLSKKVKNGVKQAIKFIDDFETTATDIAIDNGFDYVVCGHIHQPCIKMVDNNKGKVMYLNSGDWIENLTALEYHDNKWELAVFKDLFDENAEAEEDELNAKLPDIELLYKHIVETSTLV
jgi:UDP-2,3-diacylglucosamine pyrophosphatase LpxH